MQQEKLSAAYILHLMNYACALADSCLAMAQQCVSDHGKLPEYEPVFRSFDIDSQMCLLKVCHGTLTYKRKRKLQDHVLANMLCMIEGVERDLIKVARTIRAVGGPVALVSYSPVQALAA